MRPELLVFSGLHSYRDRQTLDFRSLGADGLFGIFGPTGSGKSTILDAITLALYGSVDRASLRTRGIINLAEESAETSFTFRLANERYRAERIFSRDPGDRDSAHCDHARLIRDPEGEDEVLASAAKATNGAVEELLGLSSSEFARAVVLPQGKFDQFLRLTGGERARMLEHIFRLEMYGDRLATRAKGYTQRVSGEIDSLDRAMTELGDCSCDRLVDLREEYRETYLEYREAVRDTEELAKTLEELKKLHDMTEDLHCAEEKLRELGAQGERISHLRERLRQGRSAETMRSVLNRVKDQRKRVGELEAQKRNLKRKLQRAVSVYERVLRRYEEGRAEGQERLRDLENLSDRLRRVTKDAEELENLHGRLAEVDENCQELEEEICRLKKHRADLADRRTRHNLTAEEMDASRAEIEFSEAEEEELGALRDASRRFGEIGEELVEVEESLRREAESCRRQREEIVTLYREMDPETSIAEPEEMPAAAKQLLEAATLQVSEAEEEWRERFVRQTAAELAVRLRRGEPCPVCGSREHPNPARESSSEDGEGEEHLRAARERRERIDTWHRKIITRCDRWKALRDRALQLREEYSSLRRRRRELRETFGGADGSDPATQWRRVCDRRERRMDRVKTLRESAKRTRRQLGEIREDMARLDRELEQSETQLQDVRLERERLRSRGGALRDAVAEVAGSAEPATLRVRVCEEAARLRHSLETAERAEAEARDYRDRMRGELQVINARLEDASESLVAGEEELRHGIERASFADEEELENCLLEPGQDELLEREIVEYGRKKDTLRAEIDRLEKALDGRRVRREELDAAAVDLEAARQRMDELTRRRGSTADALRRMVGNRRRHRELNEEKECLRQRRDTGEHLVSLLSGRKLVTFLASEHLADMTDEASRRLRQLTGGRFGLEMDESSEFAVRDEHNGGLLRPAGSLSGGETFLASLSLALALSSKIQLRGRYPLGFFFLDEGFGTLDESRLEVVMNSLERLKDSERMVGLISHVAEIKHRLSRFAEVIPPGHGGQGSKVVTRGLPG